MATQLQATTVGEIRYRGDHTWRGLIEVGSDHMLFSDGRITVAADPPAGIPEGVVFRGDRRHITLRNLQAEGVGNGITVGNDQAVSDLTIENCRFIQCRTPNPAAEDTLLSARGYGIFGSKGRNWTIRGSTFQTKCRASAETAATDTSSQYAARLGAIRGLTIQASRFENNNGKPCVWLMFVHDAVIENSQFVGGRFLVGARPGDMGGVEKGDCRNLAFRDCTFEFGVSEDWPQSMNIYPGSENIRFERCSFKTAGDWWLEVDSRHTANVHWDACRWNGQLVEGYTGVRSSMHVEEMAAKDIGPLPAPPAG